MKTRHNLKVAYVQLISPYGTIYPTGLDSLKALKQVGVKAEIYVGNCRATDVNMQAKSINDQISPDLYTRIWISLSDQYSPDCTPWSKYSVEENCKYLIDLMTALKKLGK